jgi:hypothetical protein
VIENGKWIRPGTGQRERTLMMVLSRKNTACIKGRESELNRETGVKMRWTLGVGNISWFA